LAKTAAVLQKKYKLHLGTLEPSDEKHVMLESVSVVDCDRCWFYWCCFLHVNALPNSHDTEHCV